MRQAKFFASIGFILTIICVVGVNVSIILWALDLPQTVELWRQGAVMGWTYIFVICTVLSFMMSLPAVMLWDDVKK